MSLANMIVKAGKVQSPSAAGSSPTNPAAEYEETLVKDEPAMFARLGIETADPAVGENPLTTPYVERSELLWHPSGSTAVSSRGTQPASVSLRDTRLLHEQGSSQRARISGPKGGRVLSARARHVGKRPSVIRAEALFVPPHKCTS